MLLSAFKTLKRVGLAPLLGFKFAKLPSKTVNIKKSEIEEDFEGFYEDVLRVAKVTKTGRMKIEPEYLSSLLNKVTNVKEYNMLLDAYYNFVGNGALLPHKIVDNVVKKGIELRLTTTLIPLIENHNFLFYYPSPEVITLFISDIIKNENYELMQKFIKLFSLQRLLRPDVKTYEIMISESLKTTHFKNGLKLLSQLVQRQMVVSMSGFEDVSECAIYYYLSRKKHRKLPERIFNKLQSVLNTSEEKSSGAYLRLAWLHLLRKEHGSFSFSILTLEDYCKRFVEEKTKKDGNDKSYVIFENSKLFRDYVVFYQKKVLEQDDHRYMLKFDRFFSDFERTYGLSHISPEVLPMISECREKLVEKAKEIQTKIPEISEKEKEKLAAQIEKRNKRFKQMEFKRRMRIEERKTAMEEEKKQRRIAKDPSKSELAPMFYEVRRKRTIKRKVVDVETGKVTIERKNNDEGKDPNVTGVVYTRKK